jgi:hypothetical protein
MARAKVTKTKAKKPAPGPDPMLEMIILVVAGGQERTRDQFRDLFARAGLQLRRVVPTGGRVSIIEAARA